MPISAIEPGSTSPGFILMILRGLAVVSTAILIAGCSKPITAPTAPPTSGGSAVSFKNDVQPIFTSSCAVSGCHAGPQPQDGMDLSPGNAYGQIVDVPCVDVPGYVRVKPFDADSSFLYLKITGSPIAGIRMPYQRPPLSDTLINTIRDWINRGAKNN